MPPPTETATDAPETALLLASSCVLALSSLGRSLLVIRRT
jgi:hypothetical protein